MENLITREQFESLTQEQRENLFANLEETQKALEKLLKALEEPSDTKKFYSIMPGYGAPVNPALQLLRELRECDDVTELEQQLHIKTLWELSIESEEIKVISTKGGEPYSIFFMDISGNYYILISKTDAIFSEGAFAVNDEEGFYSLWDAYSEIATDEESEEGGAGANENNNSAHLNSSGA